MILPQRTPEPSTEEEAQEIRAFLEEGAEVALEVIETFPAHEAVIADLNTPATIGFSVTTQDLLGRLRANVDTLAILDLEFPEGQNADQYFVHLFVDRDDATSDTNFMDPHFGGAFAFFCDVGEGQDSSHACFGHEGERPREQRDLTQVLGRLDDAEGELRVTLVLIPLPERTGGEGSLTVRGAEVSLVRSIVGEAG